MKGVFNRKPPQTRYAETWDVKTMLEHLRKLGNNKDLSLKELTHKLAMLMALMSASKSSELHQLDPSTMSDLWESISFPTAGLTKGKRVNNPHMTLHSTSTQKVINWMLLVV